MVAILLVVALVAGVLMAVVTPLLAAPAGVMVEPWSQVDGTDGRAYIADQHGRALQFRGINVKADHPAQVATDDLMADAQARGFNLLRLAIYWDTFEPVDDQWDEAYFAEVQTVLDRAEAHGIWVILDMHQDNFNQRFAGGRGFPDWVTDDGGLPFTPHDVWFLNALEPALQEAWENLYTRPSYRAAQLDAWDEVVARFSSDPALLGYDLLNEPFGKLRPDESLAEGIERNEKTRLGPMYQRITDRIRATDTTHWIFIEPPNQASIGIRTWLPAISGGRIGFFPHMYDPNIEGGTYMPGGSVSYDPKFFGTYAGVIDVYPDAHHVPVMFGEWGVAHPEAGGMDTFIRDALALMDEHGSGWTAFTGCRGQSYCVWDANGDDRPGIGQTTAPYAQAIAGAPTTFRWDPDTKTLLVVFSDSSATGTTDLVVPASRVYPQGWEVATSDADGTWSSAVTSGSDPGPLVVSVDTADTGGAHAICLRPAGSSAPCRVPVAPPPTVPTSSTTTTTVPGGQPPAAVPVSGGAGYTG
jgi:endoglycosylceramidase